MKTPISFFLLLIIFFCSKVLAQNADTSNVYFQALRIHLDYLDKTYGRDQGVYYVEQDDYTTERLPSIIDGHEIEVINSNEIYEKAKKQGLGLIAIRPAKWTNDGLVISVIDFGVTTKRKYFFKKGKHFFYSNSGGSSFQILGEEKNGLKLKVLHQGGI